MYFSLSDIPFFFLFSLSLSFGLSVTSFTHFFYSSFLCRLLSLFLFISYLHWLFFSLHFSIVSLLTSNLFFSIFLLYGFSSHLFFLFLCSLSLHYPLLLIGYSSLLPLLLLLRLSPFYSFFIVIYHE